MCKLLLFFINLWLKSLVLRRPMQCRLNAWARWAFASRPHEHRSPMLICVCCVWHVIKCLNTEFIGSTNTINICLILSTIYIFIPVSGCVGRVSKHCFARVYGAVKTALDLWLYKQSIYKLLARVIRMSCVI